MCLRIDIFAPAIEMLCASLKTPDAMLSADVSLLCSSDSDPWSIE